MYLLVAFEPNSLFASTDRYARAPAYEWRQIMSKVVPDPSCSRVPRVPAAPHPPSGAADAVRRQALRWPCSYRRPSHQSPARRARRAVVVRLEQGHRHVRSAGEHGAHDIGSAGASELNRLEDGGARIHSAWHTWRVSTAPAATVQEDGLPPPQPNDFTMGADHGDYRSSVDSRWHVTVKHERSANGVRGGVPCTTGDLNST